LVSGVEGGWDSGEFFWLGEWRGIGGIDGSNLGSEETEDVLG
jgi:hypothetical protein